MNLRFDVEVLEFELQLKFQLQTFGVDFDCTVWGLHFKLKVEVEVKIWSWGLRLASEIKTGGWVLNIKHAVKD